jgi:hypothetical protein
MRLSSWPLAAAILAFAVPAAADPFIGFTDNTFDLATAAPLGDTTINWAASWTQTVATHDVTVRALLDRPGSGGKWWITTALGPDATLADVVASGAYTAPALPFSYDFNAQARTELASGLSFAAGSYFLVLDGPSGPFFNNSDWIGAFGAADTADLAPGFSLGSIYVATVGAFGGPANPPVDFAPASPFTAEAGRLVFELDGQLGAAAPEPATWALMIGGFGLVGAAMRRRRALTDVLSSIRRQ